MSDDFSAERVADRLAIQDVLSRWVRALDRGDFAALTRLYHPDAVNTQVEYVGDVAGLIDRMEKRHRDVEHSQHLLSPPLIEFAGPNSALVETNVMATQRIRKGAPIAVGGTVPDFVGRSAVDTLSEGRYIDRFEKRDGTWKILQRTTTFEWIRMFEVPDGVFTARPEWATGTRDRNDLVFTERAAMGIERNSDPASSVTHNRTEQAWQSGLGLSGQPSGGLGPARAPSGIGEPS